MSSQNDYNHSTESEKKKEDWMNAKWRPMMGWMYMAVCLFDFIIAPCGWSVIQALFHGGINTQWQPLTLQGAGLFHIAMGAVIGISAYGRTQEKLGGANNGGLSQPGLGTTYVPPNATTMNNINQGNQPGVSSGFGGGSSFGSPPSFGASTPPAFGAATPTITTAPPPAFGGKPTGPAQSFPAL
jgi:hypothetical protein